MGAASQEKLSTSFSFRDATVIGPPTGSVLVHGMKVELDNVRASDYSVFYLDKVTIIVSAFRNIAQKSETVSALEKPQSTAHVQ